MKKLISNRLNMYGSVLSTLNSHQSAWNNVPAFAEAVAQFTQKLAEFRTVTITEDSVRRGVRAHRDVSLNELKALLVRFIRALQLIGGQTSDSFLIARYQLIPSSVPRLSLSKLNLLCTHVDEDLTTYSAELAQLGIGSAELANYQGLRVQLSDLSTVVRDSIIAHAGVLDDLEHRNSELAALVKQMDKMVYMLQSEQPQFANAYRMSRHTFSYGKRHTPPDAGNAA